MALKDKLRRAMGRSSDVSSSDSDSTPSTRPATGTTTPSEATSSIDYNSTNSHPPLGPSMTFSPAPLQKSTSALRLTRTLTFLGSSSSGTKLTAQEKKEAKALKAWRKEDEEEWRAPKSIRPSKRKDKACQDKLRAFHLNASGGHLDAYGRNRSVCSGVSPCASRRASAELHRVLTGERKDVSGSISGSLAIRTAVSKAVDVDSEDRPTVTHLQNVGTAPVVASH